MGWNSSVGIATCYGLEGSEIEFPCKRDFLHDSRPAPGPTQPPVRWAPGIFSGGKAARDWRLHNEELNGLYSSPSNVRVIKSRRMRWAGHVTRMGEERGVYRVLVGKPEGKRPLGRPRRRWVDNIRMDLQEVGCGYMDWIGLAQDRDSWRTLVSAVMNLRVP